MVLPRNLVSMAMEQKTQGRFKEKFILTAIHLLSSDQNSSMILVCLHFYSNVSIQSACTLLLVDKKQTFPDNTVSGVAGSLGCRNRLSLRQDT